MKKLKVAVFGGSGRCIAFTARELKSDIDVCVFFDNDKKKAGHLIKSGYQYIDGDKVYVPYNNICIDIPENFNKYEFEYLVIMAGSRYVIKQQLLDLGIEPEKIIVYDRIISSGTIYIPEMQAGYSLETILLQAEERGITPEKYKKDAENLLNICRILFKNSYRVNILEILVTALLAGIEQHVIDYRGIKLDYQLFAVNPGLFMYESCDILMDVIEENMNRMEYLEGPYNFGSVKVEKNDIVLDIGANYDLFSAIAASKARNGKVYAFEPVKKTQKILKRTADLYDNIVIEPYAVSDTCGKTKINISGYSSNPGAATIMNVDINCGLETEEVKEITLDAFVKEKHISKIDFIKADIEGAERLLLAGAGEVLRRFSPKLAICTYHYPEDPALLEFLIKQANPDYVVERAYGKLFAYVNH